MKKHIYIPAVLALAVLVLGISLFLLNGEGKESVGQAMTQEEIVADLTARLTQQGVPIKAAKITSHIPFEIELVLQSSSEGDTVTPDDPLYEHATRREVDLAQKHGIEIETVKVTIVNTQGTPICWGTVVPKREIMGQVVMPAKLDNDIVAAILRKQLPLGQMSLDTLDVSLDADGARRVAIQLHVADIETANATVPEFMEELRLVIMALNANQGAQIAVYEVGLGTIKGQPLLNYVNDLQLGRQHWWQADELTKEWFPHPGPDE